MKKLGTCGGAPPATNPAEVEKKKSINPELWQACAGPLVHLPAAGTHVVYFPQGHSEQVAASMNKDVNGQIPNYPNLPSKLICLLHNVTLHADPETDEVYAQMTLQPVPSFNQEALLRSEISTKMNKPQTEFFCKTLTASDTSTHGGFSVPRRAADKIFPPLDFTMQPPARELVARDLHDNLWTFRHVYRGQPKRHLLTTGWSLFVSWKRLFAGDSVLFIRDEKQHLLLGTRRANGKPTNLSSSVLSSDSMHIGILAAAAHAAANNSPFNVFYNPRTSPSEFVIPLANYYKAVCSAQISLGMRFRMMFETEESGTRRYMGTVTGISDLDPVRWKSSQWRNLQVGWDESETGEKSNRVSIWEIEPVIAPFFICPTSSFFRMKRPRHPGMPDDDEFDLHNLLKSTMPWLGDDFGMQNPSAFSGLSLAQWMNMQQNPSFANPMQPVIQNLTAPEVLPSSSQPNILQFNPQSQIQQLDQLQKPPSGPLNPMGPSQPWQQLPDLTQRQMQSLNNQLLPTRQVQATQCITQSQDVQSPLQQPSQVPQTQDQMKPMFNGTQDFSRSVSTSSMLDLPPDSLKRFHFSQSHQQTNIQTLQPGMLQELSPNGSSLLTGALGGGGQSVITDEFPSCSTSPSTHTCPNLHQPTMNGKSHCRTIVGPDITPSLKVSKIQDHRYFSPQNYLNSGAQMDYVDNSSATSVCFAQNDVQLQQNVNPMSFNSESTLFKVNNVPGETQGDHRSNLSFVMPGALSGKGLVGSGKDFSNELSSAQPELSSPMVSQSFGVTDMAFNSIDSAINDSSFLNNAGWAPPPQLPRMRTYTKVYKRGAVGRSIDITRYSGYGELKQDLARRFGIEGQLEDRQRIGWKLVYVDLENDVLLVGDDPWEEFVNCVKCIKILSPQEVEQMSLDGGFGNCVLPNQACGNL